MGLFVLLFVLAILIMLLVVSSMLGNFLRQQRVGTEITQVEAFASGISKSVEEKDMALLYQEAVSEGDKMKGRVLILDGNGIVLADSHSERNGTRILYQEVVDVLFNGKSSSYGFHQLTNTSSALFSLGMLNNQWAVYYTASVVSDSSTVGAVLISLYIQDVETALNQTMLQLAGGSAIILLALIMVSVLFSRWITKPVESMTQALDQMSEGRFHVRVEVPSSTEFGEMASTINMMSEKLENLDETRNSFISNASHELKTPLSSIKILAESLLYQENLPEATYKEFLFDINQQVDRMVELLNDLLVLSRADQEGDSEILKGPCSVDELVFDVLTRLEPFAQENGIQLFQDESGLMVYCDRSLLHTALENIVNNGIKYSPVGGKVMVSAFENQEGTSIQIQDTGVGIPEEDIPFIFDRFFRVDKARSRDTGGTGLGLSIVDAVARLHHGKVMVTSTLEEGSIFTISLPPGKERMV